jgi:hypothetical protein
MDERKTYKITAIPLRKGWKDIKTIYIMKAFTYKEAVFKVIKHRRNEAIKLKDEKMDTPQHYTFKLWKRR